MSFHRRHADGTTWRTIVTNVIPLFHLPYGKKSMTELKTLLVQMRGDPQSDPFDIARLRDFIETNRASEGWPRVPVA